MRNQTTWAIRGISVLALAALVAIVFASGAARLRAADKPAADKPAADKPASAVSEFPDDYFFEPSTNPQQQKRNELVGKKMPELSVSDWINGEVKPEDMKGKVVIIDLWATWCGPCIASIPHNNKLVEKFKDKGLIIIGVCSSSDGQEKLADVVTAKKIAYPVCKDPELKTQKAFNLSFYPTYVAVDRKGNVRAIGLNPKYLDKVLDVLLAEKAE